MCLAIFVMMLGLFVNQPGMLQKRVRTRRKPQGDQGKNSNCSQPIHDRNVIAVCLQIN